ncbi:DoxX family protein [Nocardia sp. CDC160]|uniref:DoxX family protein n=1 Tax=Nocardia sp. CDC160 TaxID=3112166 RepID=UPI002DB899B6|nr:DoxX family protein [Nocardia sp. CDC160]MEC3915686.1 DoxX family protein [Nocardia sp. CDC160]
MFIAYLVITAITIVINGGMAVADLARAEFVRANSAAVRFPESLIPTAGVLKAAGAIGLLLGLFGFRIIGIAAAIGLLVYFVLALAVHVRERVFGNIAFPGAYFAFAAASLAMALAQ